MKEQSHPYPWPFYIHRNGQFTKKIGGKHVYFGTDYHVALRKYHSYLEGPPSSLKDSITKYLDDLKTLNRSQRHIKTMEWTLNKFRDAVGPARLMRTLKPDDFARWRNKLTAGGKNGPVSMCNHIRRVKALLNWCKENGIINSMPPKTCLQRPSKDELRKDRKKRGSKMFTPDELKKLIQCARPEIRTMILLALNGGLGPQDIALLRTTHIKGKWIDYPRPKTGIDRRIPLWPETRQALADLKRCPGDTLVFRTKQGNNWLPKSKMGTYSPISAVFTKLCKFYGLHKQGRGIYSLRHVFATVASDVKDRDAVETILGHVPDSRDVLRNNYIERIDPKRLIAVCKHVRKWLGFPKWSIYLPGEKPPESQNQSPPISAPVDVALPVDTTVPTV